MQFFIFVYLFFVFGLIINHYYVFAVISLILPPLAFVTKNLLRKHRVKEYSQKIKKAQELFSENKTFEPFLNVNTEHWSIIELLPGVTTVRAKAFMNGVKIKRTENFNEFADLTNLEPALYPLVKAIIKF